MSARNSKILFFLFFPLVLLACKSEPKRVPDIRDQDVYGLIFRDRIGGSLEDIEYNFSYYFRQYAGVDKEMQFSEYLDFDRATREAIRADFPNFPSVPKEHWSDERKEKSAQMRRDLTRKSFDLMDFNHNGTLSREEFLHRLEELRKVDSNNDGFLSPEEVRSQPELKKAEKSKKKVVKALTEISADMKDLERGMEELKEHSKNSS